MKIRTQFITATIIFGAILIGIAVSLITTNQNVERVSKGREIASKLQQQANELSYLSSAYLFYHERQQLSRWESKYTSISNDLISLNPDAREQKIVVDNIKANMERLRAIFGEVTTSLETASQNPGKELDPVFTQVSWSRMEVQNQSIIFDASRLGQALRDQVDELRQRNIILSLALTGMFGLFLLANYILTYRRTLKSISVLQTGTRIIGQGNLDFAIPDKGNDEIGELSRALNLMTANLKGVTASKAELEREITERKKAEKERETLLAELERRATELDAANKELEAFSYSVSHDLRAPLRHIDGFSEILLQDYADQLDEQGQQHLRIVRRGSQKMGQLIDALLKLSRVTQAEMRCQTVDLSEIAASIAAELSKEHPERRVEVSITPGLVVNGDSQLLRVALDNLLGNAWKFTAKRPIAIIELAVSEENRPPVYYVRDNGAGFDMAYADKLFVPFQRLHSEKEFSGTGIGLATVQRVMSRHGGQVWAKAEVDKGATFYFTLG